jgi:DNA-binding transcriptional MocR family regulator
VVRAIGAWILGARYKPGHVLPREDDLTESLGVSRTSLREAVKVLCAKGLLEARPRVGVRVREREHWRLLDPIVLGWHPDLTRDPELILGLIETRRTSSLRRPNLQRVVAPRRISTRSRPPISEWNERSRTIWWHVANPILPVIAPW